MDKKLSNSVSFNYGVVYYREKGIMFMILKKNKTPMINCPENNFSIRFYQHKLNYN